MKNNAIEKISNLLKGRIPSKIEKEDIVDDSKQALTGLLNQLISFMEEMHDFIIPLSKGELTDLNISKRNYLASPFKELHSRLLHLTWQTKHVANGDFSQRVDFMGEFSEAFNSMVISLADNEKQLKLKITELENALSEIKTLKGLVPICSHCKSIRDDKGYWNRVESYINLHEAADFSHSVCPECADKYYPDMDIYDD